MRDLAQALTCTWATTVTQDTGRAAGGELREAGAAAGAQLRAAREAAADVGGGRAAEQRGHAGAGCEGGLAGLEGQLAGARHARVCALGAREQRHAGALKASPRPSTGA
jgi:hypothetical protein